MTEVFKGRARVRGSSARDSAAEPPSIENATHIAALPGSVDDYVLIGDPDSEGVHLYRQQAEASSTGDRRAVSLDSVAAGDAMPSRLAEANARNRRHYGG